MKSNKLTTRIAVAMVAGIVVGYLCHTFAPTSAIAKDIAGYLSIFTDIFLRLIKMVIAPLVLATLVAGLASMGDSRAVGRIGGKALGWFITASLLSLLIGLIMANLLRPGDNLAVPLPEVTASTNLKTSALNLKDFITHVFPKSIFESMAHNEILQILVFAMFFGIALGKLQNETSKSLLKTTEDVVHVMLQVTDYVMRFAPVGVFAAVASVITTQGLGILLVYGKYMASFFLALGVLWMVLIFAGFIVLGKDIFRLLKLIRGPMLLGFSTASSESAYPKLMEQLEKFGVKDRVTGFVLPLGYSFNLDGSMMYTAFAALFIAQAYDIPLTLGQQITMLLVLMVSSKGIAGVPRASLVVVAAVLPMFGLPEAGLLLVMGVDHFLDMGRTVTNVLGNAIATAAVAKWENAIEPVPEELAESESALPLEEVRHASRAA
ncbi:dicarboxylate/amino acid:cation symporter [Noviherbaspirillum sp. CPCC 100848]|uniref:Dicarboxylate/amino acid:cation symporter n=1 Tax=Noviherbaspirillum album TaxID=3080276 RepID=A0ABU6J1U8_9BURK|nr:dicarboxylate/amino acid:cation symporter [Noviherbaspirillum sp. CPCC 100848]MEC4717592.1 dicarboxylate/amino acid:cation symporter [Noviherbaspirillum sp. CPCC 100848]